MAEYNTHLESACRIFLEFAHIGEHTELRYDFDPNVQVLLKFDRSLLGVIMTMLLRSQQTIS